MGVHVTSGVTDLGLPRILYANVARSASLLASGSQSGYPAAAAQIETTHEFWKPPSVPATWRVDLGSAMIVDSGGIAAHDLGSVGAQVQWQYSTNDTDWLNASNTHSPTDDSEILSLFPPQTARYWRPRFTDAIPTVGVIYLGSVLVMEKRLANSHSPMNLSRQTEMMPSISEGGQWLGRSITRVGLKGTAQWQSLHSSWYRQYFEPFALAARSKPFFFAWNPLDFPQDVSYCWTDDDIVPIYRVANLVDVNVVMSGADRLS